MVMATGSVMNGDLCTDSQPNADDRPRDEIERFAAALVGLTVPQDSYRVDG